MNIIYEVLNSKLWHYTNCIYYTEATLQYIAWDAALGNICTVVHLSDGH